MAFSHTLNQTVTVGSRAVSASNVYSDTGQANVDESIGDGVSDGLVAFALTVAQIISIFMLSDQDLTVKTNSSGAADETIELVANVPYVWTNDCYYANLLATDITKLYVTNASGETASFKIEALYDATA